MEGDVAEVMVTKREVGESRSKAEPRLLRGSREIKTVLIATNLASLAGNYWQYRIVRSVMVHNPAQLGILSM